MVQPIDYRINVQSPFEAALGGFKIGADIAQMQRQREAEDIRLRQQQAAESRLKTYQDTLSQVISKPSSERTWEDFEPAFATAPNKEQIELLKTMQERGDATKLQSQKNFASNILLSLETNPNVTKNILDERISAEKDPQQKQFLQSVRQVVEESPQAAAQAIELGGAALYGKEWYEGISKVRAERRTQEEYKQKIRKETAEAADTPERLRLANQLTQAQIKNLDSQINDRASRLNLDRDELQSKVDQQIIELRAKGAQLTPDATKLVNESAVASIAAERSSASMLDLANRLEKEGGGYGKFSGLNAWLRNATGNQDSWTQTRQEYVRLRNAQGIKSLPPGPATDRDIQLALKGFPDENADAATIASFLRGMAKLSQFESVAEKAKSEWINSVGSLGRARTDIEVDGVRVPRGSSYIDFTKQILDKKAQELSAKQAEQTMPERSYMRWANPQTGKQPVGPATFGGQ